MSGFDAAAMKRRATDIFEGFTAGQKTMLGLVVLAIVVSGFLFTRMTSNTEYTALFGDLSAADAAEVTEALSSRGIAYELADGGTTVMVPRDDVYQLRIDLSAEGLPAGGSKGYALLDEHGITTSEFRQRVDYQRAMEGELSKTIMAIDGVSNATVHLVMPEEDLFSDDATAPSASVLVHTDGTQAIGGQQVQAIVHLVASSVEGLQPEAITVADGEGRVLSAPGEDGGLAASGDLRAGQTAAFEADLATSIEEMLAPVVGTEHAIVRVSADLDYDQRSITTERFSEPDTAPVLNETTSEETYTGTGDGGVGGALGPDGVPAADGNQTDYTKEAATRAFAVGKVTEQVKGAPGGVRRLSVAVLLDAETAAGVDNNEVERLVTAAAGLDLERGDSLAVSEMTFEQVDEGAEVAAEEPASGPELMTLIRTGGALLLVLVILLLAWRSARRASVYERTPVALPAGTPSLPELEAELTALQATVLEPLEPLEISSGEADDRVLVTNQINELIDRQPDQVAQVLRGWLADRRT